MSGHLTGRLTAEGVADDAGRSRTVCDTGLPLQFSTLSDAIQGALQNRDSDRLGANLDVAVATYCQRQDIVDVPVVGRDAMITEALRAIERARDVLESPIERALLPWLVFGRYGSRSRPVPICLPGEDTPPGGDLFIAPQLSFGRYRLDFGIAARSRNRSLLIAVECDGAAFHDRRSDVRRDAFLAGFRIPTVRASGSEIRFDPRSSVRRVAALIEAWSESAR